MSRPTATATGQGPVSQQNFEGPKNRRRSAFGDPTEKESDSSSQRGRKYSLSRVPSPRSDSSYSRHSSPDDRQRRRPRRRSYASSYSRSRSPPRRNSGRRSREADRGHNEKPWFKKKSIWATVASLASVASVAAVSMSTQATRQSAAATRKSARAVTQSAEATKASARATREGANASNRVAREAFRSTQAAVNTAVANGHQDHSGRYVGPPPRQGRSRHRDESNNTWASRNHNLLEYQPLTAKVGY